MTPPADDPDSDAGRSIVYRRRLNAHARHLNHAARNAGNVLFLVSGMIRRGIPIDFDTALTVEDSARKLVAIVDELCLHASGATVGDMTPDEKKYTIDKVLDIAGAAAIGVPMFLTGLPGWAVGLCSLGAWVFGRAASGRGVPLVSSFKTRKPDARGQVADDENPR